MKKDVEPDIFNIRQSLTSKVILCTTTITEKLLSASRKWMNNN